MATRREPAHSRGNRASQSTQQPATPQDGGLGGSQAAVQAAAMASTLDYINYLREMILACRSAGLRQSASTSAGSGVTMTASLALSRLLQDKDATPWHIQHINCYLSACAALEIPPFPIESRKVLLRFLNCSAILPPSAPRVSQILDGLPLAFKALTLPLPNPPAGSGSASSALVGALRAFRFIHTRTNPGWPGVPDGPKGELKRSEWDSVGNELRWIRDGLPAAPFCPFGCSLELAKLLPFCRQEAGEAALQMSAHQIVVNLLSTLRPETAIVAGSIYNRHATFLKTLSLPVFPITAAKISLDLVRRVALPGAIEVFNVAKAPGDESFGGYWSRLDVEDAVKTLCIMAERTKMFWPKVATARLADERLQAIMAAAPIVNARGEAILPGSHSTQQPLPAPPVAAPPPSVSVRSATAAPAQPLPRSQVVQPAPEPRRTNSAPVPQVHHSQQQQRIGVPTDAPLPEPTATAEATVDEDEMDFEEAYRALFALTEDPSSPPAPAAPPLPATAPVYKPSAIVRPPSPVLPSPLPTPPTTAIPKDDNTLTTSALATPGVLAVESAHPPSAPSSLLPSGAKRPASPSAISTNAEGAAAKKARLERQESATAILGFCEAWVGVFGETGDEKGGGTMGAALDELKALVKGVEWLSV